MIIVSGIVRADSLQQAPTGFTSILAFVGKIPAQVGGSTEWKDKWYNLRAFGRQAESIDRLIRKGSIVQVVAEVSGYINREGVEVEQYRFIHLKPIAFFGKKQETKANE